MIKYPAHLIDIWLLTWCWSNPASALYAHKSACMIGNWMLFLQFMKTINLKLNRNFHRTLNILAFSQMRNKKWDLIWSRIGYERIRITFMNRRIINNLNYEEHMPRKIWMARRTRLYKNISVTHSLTFIEKLTE